MMTVQAQNALLKTIEEPPEYAVIMLLTENADMLLPTITSRCVMLKLRNIKDKLIKKYLMEKVAGAGLQGGYVCCICAGKHGPGDYAGKFRAF